MNKKQLDFLAIAGKIRSLGFRVFADPSGISGYFSRDGKVGRVLTAADGGAHIGTANRAGRGFSVYEGTESFSLKEIDAPLLESAFVDYPSYVPSWWHRPVIKYSGEDQLLEDKPELKEITD